jgi:hypothetical protein
MINNTISKIKDRTQRRERSELLEAKNFAVIEYRLQERAQPLHAG